VEYLAGAPANQAHKGVVVAAGHAPLVGRPGEIAGRVPGAAFSAAIASRHPDQAPKAMVCLGELYQRAGRTAEAEAAFHDTIATGHPDAAHVASEGLEILRSLASGEGSTPEPQ
jgi:hypothetical protein